MRWRLVFKTLITGLNFLLWCLDLLGEIQVNWKQSKKENKSFQYRKGGRKRIGRSGRQEEEGVWIFHQWLIFPKRIYPVYTSRSWVHWRHDFSDQPQFSLIKFPYNCSKLKQNLENYLWRVELKRTCVSVLHQVNLFKLRKIIYYLTKEVTDNSCAYDQWYPSVSCSAVSSSFATSWTVACQAPLSMEFPK